MIRIVAKIQIHSSLRVRQNIWLNHRRWVFHPVAPFPSYTWPHSTCCQWYSHTLYDNSFQFHCTPLTIHYSHTILAPAFVAPLFVCHMSPSSILRLISVWKSSNTVQKLKSLFTTPTRIWRTKSFENIFGTAGLFLRTIDRTLRCVAIFFFYTSQTYIFCRLNVFSGKCFPFNEKSVLSFFFLKNIIFEIKNE